MRDAEFQRVVTGGHYESFGDYVWLLVQIAIKDFKMRYTHSFLGYAWSIVNPLSFFVLYYVVFTRFMNVQIGNYAGFLLLGMMLWNFFAEATTNGTNSLLVRGDLLKNVPVPREVLVYASLLNSSVTFLINMAIFFAALFLTGHGVKAPAVFYPLLVVDHFLMTSGMALMLSALFVRFRDIGYLWALGLQIGFWLTPVVYLDLMMPERWRWIVAVNPVGRIIRDSHRVLVYGEWPGPRGLVITTVIALLIFATGRAVFRRLQDRLAEYL